ncbi:MFS transporter [Sphaerisporangium krabiense]|nr:MFS transporter [Sphaerisporangium krabiense]GII62156.1 MFS transporter [Sphaerisporangium krabiense]
MSTESQSDSDAPAAPRDRGLWANHDFTKFWVGETISLMGVQVTALALPLTAVISLHAGAEQTGALRFVQFIPFLFLSLLFGVWADRRRKRPLMITANVIRCVLIALVPVLAWLDALSMFGLYALALGIGVCTVLFDVCWMSYVPTLVQKEHLVEANGKVNSSFSVADLAGPGISGLIVQIFTAPYALLIDAFSYLVSVFTLTSIKRPEPEPTPGAERHLGREIREGIVLVTKNPFLRVIATIGSAYNFCYMFIDGIFVLYCVRTLGFNAFTIGLVFSLSSVGGLLGSLAASRFIKRFPYGRIYVVAVVVGYSGWLLVPLVTGPTWLAAAVIGGGFVFTRFGLSVANVVALSLRQAVTPQNMMARMTAGMRTLLSGLGTLGALAGGFVGASLGLREAIWIGAIASVVATVPLFLSIIPRLQKLPESPEEALEFAAAQRGTA